MEVEEKYFTGLREYKRLLSRRGLGIVFLILIGVLMAVLPGLTQGGIWDNPIQIILIALFILPFVIFSLRVAYFKCPKCGKLFSTKYYILNYFQTTECIHCGLSLSSLPEIKRNLPRKSSNEWFK